LGGNVDKLHAAFDRLANDPHHPMAHVNDFVWYQQVSDSVHVDQFDPHTLSEEVRKKLHNFEPLPDDIAACIGYEDTPLYMTSWRDTSNEYGYWGEAATMTAVPDDSLWPK
jgi:hypothetical protein